jgi:hypothetical protein
MRRVANWFRRTPSTGRAPSLRPATSRPQAEELEGRQLLSATAAIYSPYGYPASNFYAIDAKTRQVVDYNTAQNLVTGGWYSAIRIPLGGPQHVTDVAAGFLSFTNVNKPEVFALTAGHQLWAYLPTPGPGGSYWVSLGSGFTAISATDDVWGSVFAINQKGQVLEHVPYGPPGQWTFFGRPGVAVKAISASKDPDGKAEVFALGADGHIYLGRFGANGRPAPWVTVDRTRAYRQISATDQNTVYALGLKDGQITKETEFVFSLFGLHFDFWLGGQLPAQGVWATQISAGTDSLNRDVVYAIDRSSGQPYVFSAQGQWQRMDGSHPKEICAAAWGWYFDVDGRFSLPNEYNPFTGWYYTLDLAHPVL